MFVEGDAVLRDKFVFANGVRDSEPPRQLPPDIPGFTGRADVLARLGELLEEYDKVPAPLIVTISGMAGVGKTALAVHWAYRICEWFPDGQLFLDLRGNSRRAALSAREALGQALRALDVPAERTTVDEDELAALFRSRAAGRRLLLVLDDAADVEQVQPLLPGSPSCVIVVTARVALSGLVARYGARPVPLGPLSDAEAIELLGEVAGRERTEAEPEAAAELVRKCARLPLALRVAAANLVTRPKQTVADTVQAVAELGFDPDLAGAVDVAFSLSYRGLDPELRRAFRLLGLVEGPNVTPDTAATLLAITPEAARRQLARLEAASLVQAVGRHRYGLHELLREYARGRAMEEDDRAARDSAVQRLAAWYLAAAQEAGRFFDRYRRTIRQQLVTREVDPEEHAARLEWFELERENLMEVIAQTARLGWDELTWELADAVFDFYELCGYSHANLAAHRMGLAAAVRKGNLLAEFFMRHHLAVVHREIGETQAALAEAERAYAIADRTQDRYGQAAVLDNLARIRLQSSDYRGVLTAAAEALAIHQEISDRHGEAVALDTMARGHRGLSAHRAAFDCARQALAIRQEIQDLRGAAETLINIAHIHLGWGEDKESWQAAERALDIRRGIGDRPGAAEMLAFLGYLHMWTGRHGQAKERFEQALELRREIGDRPGVGQDLVCLSTINRRLGAYDEAIMLGLEALDLLQELGDRHGEAEALDSLARSYRRRATVLEAPADRRELAERARREAQRSLRIRRTIGDRLGEADTLTALALVDVKSGRLRSARALATRSLRIRRRIDDRRGQGSSLDVLAQVYRAMGLFGKAARTAWRALALERETGHVYGEMVTLRSLGRIAYDLGDLPGALGHLQASLALAEEVESPQGTAKTQRLCAEIYQRLGRSAEAAAARRLGGEG